MNNFMNSYFGPLSKEWCVYFYALSIIFGISFMLSIFSIAGYIVFNFKKVNTTFVVNSLLILLNTFLAYMSNRLLNTMCVRSVM